jgi:hypothetical protein
MHAVGMVAMNVARQLAYARLDVVGGDEDLHRK